MSKLLVIVGSTRPTRSADLVLQQLTEKVSRRRAFDEIIVLQDWPLPIFGEHFDCTIGDFNDPTCSEPVVLKAWNDKTKGADACPARSSRRVQPASPGILKNAIDSVWVSFGFRNKRSQPSAAQAGRPAVRAIEHLARLPVGAESVPVRSNVVCSATACMAAINADSQPKNYRRRRRGRHHARRPRLVGSRRSTRRAATVELRPGAFQKLQAAPAASPTATRRLSSWRSPGSARRCRPSRPDRDLMGESAARDVQPVTVVGGCRRLDWVRPTAIWAITS